METLKERLESIIQISYNIICNKIVGGLVHLDNEASLQLQIGVVLKAIGQMYEFEPDDRFSIVLEHEIRDEKLNTWKSKGRARIDAFLTLANKNNSCSAAIEIKYFPKAEGETVTDNRFAMLGDIENLENYFALGQADLCYFFLYTTNKNYLTDSRSMVKIGNEQPVTGSILSNNRLVSILGNYQLRWDTFNNDNNYFLLLKVQG